MDLDFTTLAAGIPGTPLEPLAPLLQGDFIDGITHGDFRRWRRLLREMPVYDDPAAESAALESPATESRPAVIKSTAISFGDTVRIGTADALSEADRADLEARLRAFIPWRKGPFQIHGILIDSEWRSDKKWLRLARHIQPLAGRTVLDIGCANGYFGFRMLEAGARLVLGLEPHPPYAAQFWAVKHFQPALPLYVLPAALEQLPPEVEAAFDTVFSMGVIYHRPSPIDHLRKCRACLRPGGELVLETLYTDGEEGYSLMPVARYARINNVWFVPSIKTLLRWLQRCGFEEARVLDESVTTAAEQRRSDWMPFDSLESALQPDDPSRTVEGLPAPRRVIISARRPT